MSQILCRLASFVAVFSFCVAAFGASYHGIRSTSTGGIQLVIIDSVDGQWEVVGSEMSGPVFTPAGVAAVDIVGRRLFFTTTFQGETDARVLTVGLFTNTTLDSQILGGSVDQPLTALAWDASALVLHAVRQRSNGVPEVISLDPATGTMASIGDLGVAQHLFHGIVAQDEVAPDLFFFTLDPANSQPAIVTMDTSTGAVLGQFEVFDGLLNPFTSIGFQPSNSTLVGARRPPDFGRQLTELDPLTGLATIVGPSQSPPLVTVAGAATISKDGAVLAFVAWAQGESDPRLFSIRTATGALLSSPVLTGMGNTPLLALNDLGFLFRDGFESGALTSNAIPIALAKASKTPRTPKETTP